MYNNGQGVPKDDTAAVKWFRKAAEGGDAKAQYELARAYATGEGVRRDSTEALRWYRKAAEQGDADAQALFYPDLRANAPSGVVGDPRGADASRAEHYLAAWAGLLDAAYSGSVGG